jgi:protein-L-isoaspartate O-methyltransferase
VPRRLEPLQRAVDALAVEEITADRPGLPGGFDPRVKEAMARVPRRLFVPQAQRPYAYENQNAQETADLLKKAKSVIIVPGYGMAVAQARRCASASIRSQGACRDT